jgi:hypothetical protein
MSTVSSICLKTVRWSSWLLLPVVAAFVFTGYAIAGQYGLSHWCDEKTALALHRMLHWPLIILVLVHSAPAVYLALQRWGWIKQRDEAAP